MQKARANIYVYSSARISGLIFEHEKTVWYQELNNMMCMIDLTWCDIYTTNCEIYMWYQIKQKQEKMPKARANINVYRSTPSSILILEDEMICTARYVIRVQANSRRCQKHERTSTYTAVRAFVPVEFLNSKILQLYRMMIPGTAWYVERNRTGLLVSC